MNENNTRLIQHLTTNNPPPNAAPTQEKANQPRRSHRLGDHDSQSHHSTGRVTPPEVIANNHQVCTLAQVLMEIKKEEFVKWPGKIKTNPLKRNENKYCEFHRDHGHNIEDYFQLKEQIADLIKKGYPWRLWIRGILKLISEENAREANRRAKEEVDQVVSDLRDEAPPDHDMARFHCCGLPLALQCNPRSPDIGKNQGHHFYRPPDNEVFHFNKGSEIDNAEMEALRDEINEITLVDPRQGCGAGLVLQTPSGEHMSKHMEYAIRIGFKATTNEAEYEVLLARLRVATELGVESLDTFRKSGRSEGPIKKD
ncbi:hypothetical protein Acr_07g0013820 [Actinidia rufa]|uniref:Retrotransposon gag domain-containing protein n=1 Tax=Actinidia rufa TaxID=165716 RepID=A0A7J0EYC4_9ERIC|nr:hypothetical protein Acr_07g0013820 [Actinidia rufa]